MRIKKTFKPSSNTPKPCPTCYVPMRRVGTTYECAKHGPPTRA